MQHRWAQRPDAGYEDAIAQQILQGTPGSSTALSEVDVPVRGGPATINKPVRCSVPISVMATGGSPLSGQVWDMERVHAFKGREGVIAQGIFTHLILNAQRGGLDWSPSRNCNGSFFTLCGPRWLFEAQLQPGGDFFQAYGIQAKENDQAVPGKPALVVPTKGYGTVVAWYGGAGLILYDVLPQQTTPGCGSDLRCFADFFVLDNAHTVVSDPDWSTRALPSWGWRARLQILVRRPKISGIWGQENTAWRRLGRGPGDAGSTREVRRSAHHRRW